MEPGGYLKSILNARVYDIAVQLTAPTCMHACGVRQAPPLKYMLADTPQAFMTIDATPALFLPIYISTCAHALLCLIKWEP